MNDKLVRSTLRIDRQLFAKFRYVADYNGRSANREIEKMIKNSVDKFEEKHGKIVLETKEYFWSNLTAAKQKISLYVYQIF